MGRFVVRARNASQPIARELLEHLPARRDKGMQPCRMQNFGISHTVTGGRAIGAWS